jgi:hypothetical protein
MNKPKTEKTGRHAEAPPPNRSEQSLAGSVLSESGHKRKPSGPVTYKIQKGADVWPGRK